MAGITSCQDKERLIAMTTVGLVNPGAMGASVGAAIRHNNHPVIWASEGRSAASGQRAEKAGLSDVKTLAELVQQADILLSVCPPGEAATVAAQVASLGFRGVYVDANAISPANCRKLAGVVADARFVDGGIIGGPAWSHSSNTRLYLSGPPAHDIAALFDGSPLTTRVLSDRIGAASALKMCFAAYTKGSAALLGAIESVAEHEGVRADLEQQWGEEFSSRTSNSIRQSSAKAWRFEAEMREIAATFREAGLPGDFHQAAADIYARLGGFKDADPLPEIDDILRALLNNRG